MKRKITAVRSLAGLMILTMTILCTSCKSDVPETLSAEKTTAENAASTEANSLKEESIEENAESVTEIIIGETGETKKTEEIKNEADNVLSDVLNNPPYVTYTYKNAAFLESVANQNAYNTQTSCTAMQGMGSSEKYLYVAKQRDNAYANIVQYDAAADTQRTMAYYDSLDATDQTALDSVSHCNDMAIYRNSDANMYMIAATTYHPESEDYAYPSLTRLQMDEENATLRLTGFFNLIYTNDEGEPAYFAASSIRHVAQTQEYHYFLVKNAYEFYWFKLPMGVAGASHGQLKHAERYHSHCGDSHKSENQLLCPQRISV